MLTSALSIDRAISDRETSPISLSPSTTGSLLIFRPAIIAAASSMSDAGPTVIAGPLMWSDTRHFW